MPGAEYFVRVAVVLLIRLDLMEARNRSKAGRCWRILADLCEVLVAIAPSSGQREPWQFQVSGEAASLPRANTTLKWNQWPAL